MRIFVAGATGAVGKRLIPLLVAGGHYVIATTRTPDKLERLRAEGADPVVVDGLDRDAMIKGIVSSHPDAIVHQMTALASMRSLKHFDDEFAVTNPLRTEGTSYLLEARSWSGTPLVSHGSGAIRNRYARLLPRFETDLSKWIAFVPGSYLIGHLLFMTGSVLDSLMYDAIRSRSRSHQERSQVPGGETVATKSLGTVNVGIKVFPDHLPRRCCCAAALNQRDI